MKTKGCTILVYTPRGTRSRAALIRYRGLNVFHTTYDYTDSVLVAECAKVASEQGFNRISIIIEKD